MRSRNAGQAGGGVRQEPTKLPDSISVASGARNGPAAVPTGGETPPPAPFT